MEQTSVFAYCRSGGFVGAGAMIRHVGRHYNLQACRQAESLLSEVGWKSAHVLRSACPLCDIASAWPHTRRLPVQKIRLALCIGGHYRMREILPRHFRKLAIAGSYSADALLTMPVEFCRRLPDEPSALFAETAEKGMSRAVLVRLVDGTGAQRHLVQRHIGAAS